MIKESDIEKWLAKGFTKPLRFTWEYDPEFWKKSKDRQYLKNIVDVSVKEVKGKKKLVIVREFMMNPRVMNTVLRLNGQCPCKPYDRCLCPQFLFFGFCKCALYVAVYREEENKKALEKLKKIEKELNI